MTDCRVRCRCSLLSDLRILRCCRICDGATFLCGARGLSMRANFAPARDLRSGTARLVHLLMLTFPGRFVLFSLGSDGTSLARPVTGMALAPSSKVKVRTQRHREAPMTARDIGISLWDNNLREKFWISDFAI